MASHFEIDATTGEITVAADAVLDFESTPELTIQVTASDNAEPAKSTMATVTITLRDINDPPTLNASSYSVAENSIPGSIVGNISAEDPDAGETLRFEIVDQTLAWLIVDANTGELRVADNAIIDFESESQNSITIRVTDAAGLTAQAAFQVAATNVNEPPTLAKPIADMSVEVNHLFSFTIPSDTFTDQDVGDSFRYVMTTADGFSLPSWLTFDGVTQTLSGTPTTGNLGKLSVKLTALGRAKRLHLGPV